jgi:transmembrane sensor
MNRSSAGDLERDAIDAVAAQWTVRRDRGLSAAESIEFELWLAGDARHSAAIRRLEGAWSILDRTPESTARRELALAKRRRARRRFLASGSLAAAAAVTLASFAWWHGNDEAVATNVTSSALFAAGPREVFLADGTLVRLNAGGEVSEDFDAQERRVQLTRGEAHFDVVKDAARPFVVIAGALRVRAVGTAFNVHLQSGRVEVLVTEGRVQLAAADTPGATEPILAAGERAVLARPEGTRGAPAPAIVVTRIDAAEITRTLAWHDSVMRLGGATLAQLANEFEHRFGQRMVIADPAIAQLRAGGRLRGDDPENVAKLLATTFDLAVERAADGAWVLRRKNPNSR